jgi:ankyrin repeat protein
MSNNMSNNTSNNISNEDIIILLKNNNFDKIYNLIETKKIKNFDFRDSNYNYFIQYIVNYNQYKILKLILKPDNVEDINIRLDILDSDGRSILYNCIKYNYIEMLNELINFNKLSIGISIIDIKDRLGLTALHYSVIFNNFETLKILIENNADPYLLSNDGSNIFVTCLTYKRNNMIDYLIKNKFNLNFISHSGETLLQMAVNYQNNEVVNKLLDTNININNINSDYGLNILHQSIILDNFDLFKKLLNKDVDINLPDFYGNSPLHYILIDKRLHFLSLFFSKPNIKFNTSNINGEIPLHILLDMYKDIDNDINDNINTIITKIILESDLNIQNNQGVTCLMKIIKNNLQNKFRDLLVTKPLNLFIEDNNTESIILTDELMDILTESFYNQIKNNKNELLLDWEKWCSVDFYDKLKTIIETKNDIIGKNSEEICKNKIKNIIKKEKRTIPKLSNIELNFDNGIFTNYCHYTGSPIDILFGLLLLNQDFKSKGLKVVLDYPLTVNKPLENYYKKVGINYQYKLDFSNIEINWSYQKMFFPSYFDDELSNIIKDANYIVIPIGIEMSNGSHANILFWDVKNKTIERFEPNGSNYPIGLNYNPELLDDLLKNKFRQFVPDIKYLSPFKFLPTISFQILENLENTKCKKIGDPNGFCGVWCIWWVYQRMLNIDNIKIDIVNIANEIIKFIKFDNQSFKSIIRNFSKKITTLRDIYLKKYKIDINDWIVSNYSDEILNNLEKNIFKNLKLI